MEITKEMYQLAKKIVDAYENKKIIPVSHSNPIQDVRVKETYELMQTLEKEKGLYLNPFEDGIKMPCCGEKYIFSYDVMKYLPRNPKLKYRYDGTIDNDPLSPQPNFVDYNGCREAIRQAKKKGLNHVHWRLSVAASEAIRSEGYKDHNDKLNTISW